MNKLEHLKSGLSSILEIPSDLAKKHPIISMIGNAQLYIENYRSIQRYNANELILLTNNGKIIIHGKKLEIFFYTNEDMYVHGFIVSVNFE